MGILSDLFAPKVPKIADTSAKDLAAENERLAELERKRRAGLFGTAGGQAGQTVSGTSVQTRGNVFGN